MTAALRVGGYLPLTTIDYPDALAAVVFCQGCGWRCHYCHNRHLIASSAPPGSTPPTWPDILHRLRARVGLLDAVVFSGGEPTLQPALAGAMREVKALGFKIGLHTNGAYPQRLERLLALVSWVGLDIKASTADYPRLTGVAHSGEAPRAALRLLRARAIPHQVRITVLPDWSADYLAALTQEVVQLSGAPPQLQPCNTAFIHPREHPA